MAMNLQNFKKIAALTVALLAISLGVNAQTWYILGEYLWSPPNPQGTYLETHYQAGDTEINGVEFHTIYNLEQGSLVGAYRNEDNQIFYCNWNGSTYDEEIMLYDYDLEVGDYFNEESGHPMKVTEVSTITDNNGVARKKISFQFLDYAEETEYWIEGIGSNKGFVYMGTTKYELVNGSVFNLLCYHIGENLIFLNPEFNTCDIDEIDENTASNSISVYPNPAKDVIKILNDNNLNITNIEIVDLTGRIVLSTDKTDDINISDLAEGQYFVKIYGESTVVKKLFIAK